MLRFCAAWQEVEQKLGNGGDVTDSKGPVQYAEKTPGVAMKSEYTCTSRLLDLFKWQNQVVQAYLCAHLITFLKIKCSPFVTCWTLNYKSHCVYQSWLTQNSEGKLNEWATCVSVFNRRVTVVILLIFNFSQVCSFEISHRAGCFKSRIKYTLNEEI